MRPTPLRPRIAVRRLIIWSVLTSAVLSCRDSTSNPTSPRRLSPGRAGRDLDATLIESPLTASATVNITAVDDWPGARAPIAYYFRPTVVRVDLQSSTLVQSLSPAFNPPSFSYGIGGVPGCIGNTFVASNNQQGGGLLTCSLWQTGQQGLTSLSDTTALQDSTYLGVGQNDYSGCGAPPCAQFSGVATVTLTRVQSPDLLMGIYINGLDDHLPDSVVVYRGDTLYLETEVDNPNFSKFPYSVDLYTSAEHWHLVHDDGTEEVGCNVGSNLRSCLKTATTSGTLHMEALVNGELKTARNPIKVIVKERHTLTVDCQPPGLVRTQTVSCKVSVAPSASFQITRLLSEGNNETIVDDKTPKVVSQNDNYNWQGPAIRSTTVTVEGKVDDEVMTPATSSFSVASRWGNLPGWTYFTFRQTAPPVQPAYGPPLLDQPYPGFVPLPNGNAIINEGAMGLTHLPYPDMTVGRVQKGPNQGLVFTTMVQMKFRGPGKFIYLSPSLLPGDPFYQKQNGVGDNCGPADMDALFDKVLEHELAHYAEYLKRTLPLDAQTTLEAMSVVVPPGQTANAAAQRIEDERGRTLKEIASAARYVDANYDINKSAPSCHVVF